MPWVLVDPNSAVCSQVCKTDEELREAIHRWSAEVETDNELDTEPFYIAKIESRVEYRFVTTQIPVTDDDFEETP